MNIKPKHAKKPFAPKVKENLSPSEVDFLKTRLRNILFDIEMYISEAKQQGKLYKKARDSFTSDEYYNQLAKLKVEYAKIAKIQHKLKRGLV